MIKILKENDDVPFIVFEESSKLKAFAYDEWYKSIFDIQEGVWVGTGAGDQTLLKINGYSKENSLEYPNDMGFYINDGAAQIIKLLDFVTQDGEDI